MSREFFEPIKYDKSNFKPRKNDDIKRLREADSWGLNVCDDYPELLPFDRIVGESFQKGQKRISFEKNGKSYIWQGPMEFFEENPISDKFVKFENSNEEILSALLEAKTFGIEVEGEIINQYRAEF